MNNNSSSASASSSSASSSAALPPPAKRPRSCSMNEEDRLLFAIPKKGRLYEKCVDLLKGAGLEYSRSPRLDIAFCTSLPVKLVFLPAKDIADFVGEGNVDLGITGQDMVAEGGEDVNELMETGFGKCRLALLAPKKDEVRGPEDFSGKRIVTSFPELTKKYFFDEFNGKPGLLQPHIKQISGSVEAACGLGLAEGIVDLIETGTTAEAAGLGEVSVIMNTQAVLISNKHSKHADLVETIRKRIYGYLFAQKYNMMYYNIPRSKLTQAQKITPGQKAPTVTQLEGKDWVSVGVMVEKKKVSDEMDRLQELGASDIVVMDIANCRA